jgi:hypothetical protein
VARFTSETAAEAGRRGGHAANGAGDRARWAKASPQERTAHARMMVAEREAKRRARLPLTASR